VSLIHPEEEVMDLKKEWRGMRGNVSLALLPLGRFLRLHHCLPGTMADWQYVKPDRIQAD